MFDDDPEDRIDDDGDYDGRREKDEGSGAWMMTIDDDDDEDGGSHWIGTALQTMCVRNSNLDRV